MQVLSVRTLQLSIRLLKTIYTVSFLVAALLLISPILTVAVNADEVSTSVRVLPPNSQQEEGSVAGESTAIDGDELMVNSDISGLSIGQVQGITAAQSRLAEIQPSLQRVNTAFSSLSMLNTTNPHLVLTNSLLSLLSSQN